MPPMPVDAVVAVSDTVVDAIAATGQIEPMQSIDLQPDVDGRVTQIAVREGARVSRGTALIRIDAAEISAQVARAAAERDLARQNLDRTKVLLDENASSAAELERAEAAFRSAEASLRLLQVRLNRTTVRAPFAGVVGSRSVSIGDYVTTSTPLMTLQTVDPQRAVLSVPERYATTLARGQKVRFRVGALPGREFVGTVDFVDPVVQLPGRTITVKAQVPNGARELQSGMFIEARLATDTRANAVIIPEDAILSIQGSDMVWVAKDGKATRRQVQKGVRTPGFIEVRSGVDAGELVVVGGQERLQEGAPVAPNVVQRTRPGSGQESEAASE